MAGIRTWRRRSSAAAITLALALSLSAGALTACSKGTNNPSGTGNGSDSQIGGAPSGTPSGGTLSGGATPAVTATTVPPPAYPSEAKAYAQELLKAWNKKDYSRMDQLAVVSAVQQIKDSISFGGLPNANWHYISCSGAAGSTYCVFRNDNGDETRIRLLNSQIGHPTAVTEAPLDRTEFPKSVSQYVMNFIGAWGTGNRQRMLAYSSSGVVDFLTHYTPITSYTLGCDGAMGSTYVMVNGIGADLGASYGLQVSNDLVSQGKQHAIVNHVDPQPPASTC